MLRGENKNRFIQTPALQRSAISIENKRINSRTPAECYVSVSTYRSSGAEELVSPMSIDMLLRWSKGVSVLCVVFVALNIGEVPESLMLNSLLKKLSKL